MALQKAQERPTGVIGDYWRIESVVFGRPNMITKMVKIHVIFALYQSKADFQAGKVSMGETKEMDIDLALSQVATFIYTQAKLTLTQDQSTGPPYFEDALDI